jgi:hypothetical protein
MGELAQEILDLANRPHHDHNDLIKIARGIIARSNAVDAAELAWAILLAVAKLQTKTEPRRRITWRPTQLKRRQKFALVRH